MKLQATVGLAACAVLAMATWADAQPATSQPAAPTPANVWLDAEAQFSLPADLDDATWATSDGYCGSTYRSKTHEIIWRSGVNSKKAGLSPGFYSNATLAWDLATNRVRVVDIANWGGGSYGGGKLLESFKADPTPTPRHTYDGLTYVADEDACYFMLGANWRISTKATEEAVAQFKLDNESTWKYSFAADRWTRIDHNIYKFWKVSPYESHLQVWPEGGKLLFLNDSGARYAEFDLKAQTWQAVDLAGRCPMSLYNARSTWDSKRQLWVFRLGPKLCSFDPKTRTFASLPPCPPAGEKDVGKGVVYIPRHDVYLVTGPTGDDTHVFDVASQRWTTIKGGQVKLPNGYPQYDPATDTVGLVYQKQAFKFRYVPTAGRAD